MAPPAPVAACIELIKARPGTQAVLLGGHGVLAFGPDTEATVSLLVALEEAAEAELRTAVLGRLSLSAPPGTLHIWGWPPGQRYAMVAGSPVRYFVLDFVLAVPHRPDHACLLGRPDRLLHRAGGHRAAQVVHGELDRAGHRRDPARTERLEPGQRALAGDRGHHRQRRPVPGLREGRVPQRPAGSRPQAARVGFLDYAKVESRSDLQVPDPRPPASGRHGLPPERPAATAAGATRPWGEH